MGVSKVCISSGRAARSPLAICIQVALATGLYAGMSSALAQDEAAETEENIEVISVTASYSRSLEQANDLKRYNTGFSDSVVATDIADFPEQNLAEALQRIPGVTIERDKGLGTRVNVRGLPTEFTHVSINGLATASGSGGRDVEFDIFASEIIQQVTIQKSPTAADEEGGIAGSVMISTARPFDYSESRFIASAEAAHNSMSGEVDPRVSFLASTTSGPWGGLASLSYATRTNRTDSNSGVDFRPLERFAARTGSAERDAQGQQAVDVVERDTGRVIDDRFDSEETSRVVFLNKAGDRVYLNDQEKWGATAALQYRPSDSFSLTLDAMLGGYNTTEDEYDAAAYSASSISTLEQIHDYDDTTLADYGIMVLTDASYTATQHEFLSKETVGDTDFSQLSLSLDWQQGPWSVTGLVGYSGASKLEDFANLKHVAFAPSRTRYTERGGETIPSQSGAGFDMYQDVEQYVFESYQVNLEEVEDDKYAAQLDITRDMRLDWLPALMDIRFGVRYTDKSKQRNFGDTLVGGPAAGDASWSNTRLLTESELEYVTDIVPGGGYRPNDINWMQPSNAYARDTFRYPGFAVDFEPGEFYRVDEEVLAGYLMANFSFDVGRVPVALNTGVRAVDTSVNSFGFHQVQNPDGSTGYTESPVSSDGSYRDFLPSLNLTAQLTDQVVLRGAASRTLMRPALTDIAYRRSVSWNEFRFSDGNPDLEPTYADQWDLGLEWYLDNGGLFAATYFEKRIEGVVRQELTGIVEDVEKLNANGTLDGYYDFDVYQPINADGSYSISGLELIAHLPFDAIHPALEGFGINSNYTMLDNSLTGASTLNIPTPPEGLADKVYNATLYFENDRFDARVSYNYKDDYVEVIERNMYPVYREGYGQVDIALGYQLSDRVRLTLKGINMSDEATRGYTIDPRFPVMNEFSGRRISLGIRADI
ncbi:TonB-dependent receptor [Aliidiomarina sedimenti]|uniref:TonB-dependent receptor n=1 Tax=Aliidiomarina sedimenti TaxID=1933879 RepID=A0ABY0BYD9_9GAMM|nr:TonB-dependent receptor [Aliidiomarina sedimenti]RUO29769.1 TonB-dependent receptor [Aliidiomarina sedimenti]